MADVDPRLLIAATPELLDGWIGPVVDPDETACVLCSRVGSNRCYVFAPTGVIERFQDADLKLDLSRAECRDRVARVLAERLGYTDVHNGLHRAFRWHSGARQFALWGPTAPGLSWVGWLPAAAHAPADGRRRYLKALADLPHEDESPLLPDGSRLVDALALAAVWRATVEGR